MSYLNQISNLPKSLQVVILEDLIGYRLNGQSPKINNSTLNLDSVISYDITSKFDDVVVLEASLNKELMIYDCIII